MAPLAPICGQSADNLWTICGQSADNLWTICGQSADNLRTICGQSADNLRTICGQSADNLRTICGQSVAAPLAPDLRQRTQRVPGVIPEGDNHRRSMTKQCLSPSNTGCCLPHPVSVENPIPSLHPPQACLAEPSAHPPAQPWAISSATSFIVEWPCADHLASLSANVRRLWLKVAPLRSEGRALPPHLSHALGCGKALTRYPTSQSRRSS